MDHKENLTSESSTVRFLCIIHFILITLAATTRADTLPTLDLQQLITRAAESHETEIQLPAGRFTVHRTVLRNLHNLTITGQGPSTILVNADYADTFVIVDSQQITLKNLAIDYDPLPFVQATITAAAPDGTSFEFETQSGYPDLSSDYAQKAIKTVAYFFDGSTRLWKRYVPHGYFRQVQIQSPTRGRVSDPVFKFFDYSSVRPGDKVVFPIKNYGNAIQIQNSRDIRVEGVTVYTAPGAGYIARRMRGDQFCRLTITRDAPPPPGAAEPRLLSTCADGFNCIVSEKGPTLDGCDFSFMGDDGVNLSGPSWVIARQEDDHTLILASRYQEPWLSSIAKLGPNIHMSILRRGTCEPLTDALATDVREDPTLRDTGLITPSMMEEQGFEPEKKRPAYFYRMRFQDPIPATVQPSDVIWSPDLSNPHFVIRNCRIAHNRGAGLSIRASHGLIENNLLERNKYLGIGLGPLISLWNEAGWVEDVVVRHNRIIDANDGQQFYRSPNQDQFGAIAVYSFQRVMPQRFAYYPGNRNIIIEDNLIDGTPAAGIWINAARDLTIRNNTLRHTGQMNSLPIQQQINLGTAWAITIQNSLHIVTENNTVQDPGPFSRGDITNLGPNYTTHHETPIPLQVGDNGGREHKKALSHP